MWSFQYGRRGVYGTPAGNEIRQELSVVSDVRVTVGFELTKECGPIVPEPDAVKAYFAAGLDDGLIRPSSGYFGNLIRILPPLTINMGHLREGFDILEVALKA